MQKVEVQGVDLAALALEGGQLVATVNLNQVGLQVGLDALPHHHRSQGLGVVGASEDSWTGGEVLDVDAGPGSRPSPSSLCQVGYLLGGAAAIHRGGGAGENGPAALDVLDVLPDLGGVLVGVDGGNTVLTNGLGETLDSVEVLLQTSGHDENIVLHSLPIAQSDAVLLGLKGLAALLDPINAHWQYGAHRPAGALHIQAQAADHGPLRLVVVLIPGLDDGDLVLRESQLSEQLARNRNACCSSADDSHLVLRPRHNGHQGFPKNTGEA
mmetsp:Transcript_11763/g.25476  ORF Transcript_11763/g.25476 Transcript_11763/m.25476 type:complete len:269 (+) Transcript_11763:1645-2451(+)